jgi:hypothetical protein
MDKDWLAAGACFSLENSFTVTRNVYECVYWGNVYKKKIIGMKTGTCILRKIYVYKNLHWHERQQLGRKRK